MGEKESKTEKETEKMPEEESEGEAVDVEIGTRRRRMRKKVKESVQKARDRIEAFSKETDIEEMMDEIRKEVENLATDVERLTQENPLGATGTTLLAGIAIGLIIGIMAGKKNDR
jgi:ElaB/YqjD/DUF883 family membrane-anchored ribosome-binding protein